MKEEQGKQREGERWRERDKRLRAGVKTERQRERERGKEREGGRERREREKEREGERGKQSSCGGVGLTMVTESNTPPVCPALVHTDRRGKNSTGMCEE